MRVEDDLKPHNRETIRRILDFFKTERKCCAIQATGTGKTFLILRLLEILNDEGKMAVIFAPNREIIRQTKKRMIRFSLDNASFYTYQKLARMTDEELSTIKADLIVCDELHRTGAKTWGKKFEALVNFLPDSKVFGATATPLRCIDGRDMAEEYFDGNKACDISLAEALVREIIPIMPTYVSALYTFEEEYQKMSDKIDKANNSSEEKVELRKELLAAKQQLEKANGVPEIIKKYITNYNGKYLVFCKNKKHLYAMKDVIIGWFREAGYDGKIFEYPYYSESSAIRKNLDNFENNEEEGLKLLFVIDKLNEGLHLDEIQGCFLLRPTRSNITYYQQIGRAIDAGSKEKRIIFDLVCNFNSLKKCNLKKELEEKAKERQGGKFSDCSKEFELDKFDVVDCIQECVNVFNEIDEKIIGSKRPWQQEEIEILVDKYNGNPSELLQYLNRNTREIQAKAARMGLSKGRFTKEDDDLLKKFYPEEGTDAFKRLKNRSKGSCQYRVHALGLKTNKSIFNKNEDKIITEYYPIMGCSCNKLLNGKTKVQVAGRARRLGVFSCTKKSKYKYVRFDNSLNKWYVQMKINGKNRTFGYFINEDEAGKVAMEKAKEYGKII